MIISNVTVMFMIFRGQLFCLIGNYDEFPIKQKTLREDATRCRWNMSAKADCIWRAQRNKSLKD